MVAPAIVLLITMVIATLISTIILVDHQSPIHNRLHFGCLIQPSPAPGQCWDPLAGHCNGYALSAARGRKPVPYDIPSGIAWVAFKWGKFAHGGKTCICLPVSTWYCLLYICILVCLIRFSCICLSYPDLMSCNGYFYCLFITYVVYPFEDSLNFSLIFECLVHVIILGRSQQFEQWRALIQHDVQ